MVDLAVNNLPELGLFFFSSDFFPQFTAKLWILDQFRMQLDF